MAAEVRCPMCGKSNPADAEVCRYCHARLKPAAPGGGASGGAPSGGDEPDWLRQLRADEPKGGKPASPGGEPSADVPDWLSRIRQKTGEPDKPSGLFADDNAGEAEPDWMKGLQDEESPASSFGDSDDWLSRLGGESSVPDKPAASGGGTNRAEEVDLAGWLQNLGKEDPSPAAPAGETPVFDDWSGSSLFADEPPPASVPAAPTAASQPPQPAADDQDDWLSSFKNFETSSDVPASDQAPAWGAGLWADDEPVSSPPAAESQPAAEPAGEENFDWLRSFTPDPATETPAQPVDFSTDQPAAPEAGQPSNEWGLTGWLNQEKASPETSQPAASEPALPDWGQIVDQPPAQPSAAPEEGLPDWLSGLPAAGAPEPPAPASQSGMPSWLMEDQPAAPEKPAEPPSAQSGVPSWLSSFDAAPPANQPPPAAQPSAADDEDLPAWMRGDFGAAASTPDQPPEQPAGELPGWFSSLSEPSADAPVESSPESVQPDFGYNPFGMDEEPASGEPAFAEPVSEASSPPVADEQPDWLQSLQTVRDEERAPEQRPEPGKGTGPLPFIEEGLPDWMNEFKGQPTGDSVTPPLIPVEEYATTFSAEDQPFNNDLPDWLSEEGAARQAKSEESSEGAADAEDLAQAELPSWVAAMRPVETAMQNETGLLDTDQRVEKAGPLSGIRGILPADDHVISYRKPPVYSMKLRVSEKQRGHAGLLESLLGQEVQPLVLPAVKSQAPQILLRVLVALFLMLVLAGALLVNLQLTPVPTFYPPEVIDLYDQVESLPAEATVLVAVDYEPGLSGEMQFASAMVMDHLMGRGAKLAIVSTVPTGPAMADSLLNQVQKNRSEYDLGANVANLGYLPGGTISLVEFARDPRGAAPRTTNGENAWEQPLLTGVDDIQKFDRVVVITDRAEVGRAWVEQVQPYLGDVPLLIVSSAQASPLLEPYVESGQVQGLVSGLMGGTLYGQRSGRQASNPALGHYGAYQVGVLLAFVLVLAGFIFSAVMSTVGRKPKNRE